MTKRFAGAAASLLTLLGLYTVSPAFAQYKLTDLGLLPGGTRSDAGGVNNLGQVAGTATDAQGIEHAFLYTGGPLQDLGTFGFENAFAVGVSATGTVAAGGFNVNADQIERGFSVTNGVAKDIGALGGNTTQVKAINASGVIVGTSDTQTYTNDHAFLYDGTMHDLGLLGGNSSVAIGINASGQVIGYSTTATPGVTHSFLYTSGVMHDLNSFIATSISDSGTLGGVMASQAAFYNNGVVTMLGTLGGATSGVYAINNIGQAVGVSDTAGGVSHSFIYANGQMTDLNTLLDPVSSAGWDINSNGPTAINAAGQILGTGIFGGNDHAYILTAIGPEPPTFWCVLTGATVLIARRRSIRRQE